MKNLFFLASILVAFLLTPLTANSQNWSNDQKNAWQTVEKEWAAVMEKDPNIANLLTDDFAGWSVDDPMPLSKASLVGWFRFNGQYSTRLKYELFPVKVIVHGDMAVTHYYYQTVDEDKEGKRKASNGRWTDILVRDGSDWKFIAWQGGVHSE